MRGAKPRAPETPGGQLKIRLLHLPAILTAQRLELPYAAACR